MNKRIFLRMFFVGELFVFGWLYMYGTHGIAALEQLEKENREVGEKIHHVQQEIDALHTTIIAWQNEPFYKEKMAREDLQMAANDEIVFILPR